MHLYSPLGQNSNMTNIEKYAKLQKEMQTTIEGSLVSVMQNNVFFLKEFRKILTK